MLIGCVILSLVVLPVFAAKIPRPAPEFVFETASGEKVALSQFKGKVLAVEFLLTTCVHCKRTSKVMQKLYNEYNGKGFQAIGIAFNDGAKSMLSGYALETGATYTLGVGNRDRVIDFMQHPVMLTMWTPQLVMIDKNGQIRAQFQGTDDFFKNEEANMRQWIETLIKE
jgi:peroxiredoxin